MRFRVEKGLHLDYNYEVDSLMKRESLGRTHLDLGQFSDVFSFDLFETYSQIPGERRMPVSPKGRMLKLRAHPAEAPNSIPRSPKQTLDPYLDPKEPTVLRTYYIRKS